MVLHTTDNPEAAARSQSSAISASTEAKAAVALSPVPSTAAARLRRIQSPIREMSAGSPSMNVSIGIGSLVHVGQAGHEVRSSVVVGSAVCGRASAENHPTRTECRDETGEVGGHLREDSGECACCGTCAHRIGEMSTDVGCSIGGCFVSLCGTVEFVGIDVQRNRVGCCVGVFPLWYAPRRSCSGISMSSTSTSHEYTSRSRGSNCAGTTSQGCMSPQQDARRSRAV